jgi:type IV pilus assembly protein PilX
MFSKTIHKNQDGAALITALVMLVILTLLGLSSMTTNIMEERMASNAQEVNRAFQASETGLDLAYADVDSFSLNNTADNPNTFSDTSFGSYSADLNYSIAFRQQTPPQRGSGWDSNYALYHFDISSSASTPGGAATSIHAGSYQVGRKQ